MKKELTYSEDVFNFLDRMDVGTIELTKLCKKRTRDKFIKVVQNYINEKGIFNGYCLEFDSNMKAINKLDILLKTSEGAVFRYLDRMPAGVILLDYLCKAENREQLISVIKLYIDTKGIYNGYCLEFNQNYTAIKKFDTILRTSIERFKESINP